MSWYSLKNLDEAMEKTKEILFPFDLLTWTKIGIIALLVGGGLNMPSIPTGPSGGGGPGQGVYTPDTDVSGSAADNLTMNNMTGMATSAGVDAATAAVFIIAFVIAGFFMYITSVFEFIYFQTILDEKPLIGESFSEHAGKGFRYLAFKIGFIIVILLSIALIVASLSVSDALAVIALLLWIPFMIVAFVFRGLVHDFVLLRMIETEESLLEAWRAVWPDVKREWRQVVMYLFVKLFVVIGIGIANLVIMAGVLLVLLIPFGLLAALGAIINPVLAVIPALIGLAVFAVIMFYVRVPFSTYLYTYITLMYHDLTS